MKSLFRFQNWFHKDGEPTCTEVRKLSSAYLEEELPEAQTERLRRHLVWCTVCNAFVATLNATMELLRGLPQRKAPPSLKEEVLKRTREDPE